MALLTLRAESTAMDVVLGMAAATDHRRFGDVLWPDMTLRAADGGVRAGQGEPGACRMIEFPQGPAIGRMTGATVFPQRAFVSIRLGVAAVATLRCLTEVLVGMALPASDRHVQSQ